MRKFLLFITLAFLSYGALIAQTTVNMSNGTTSVVAGDTIKFYDSGGATGNYSDYEDFTHTFTTTSNLPIAIRFKSFQTESASYDYIYIYDGATTSDPVLANKVGGSTIPGPYLSTGNNLTVTFRSDGSYNYSGWEAEVFLYNVNVTPNANGILYVNKNSSAGFLGNGSSWNYPLPELADALLQAKTNTAIKQIWVAAGTYKPLHNAIDGTSGDGGRDNAFLLPPNVEIYGSFYGTETNISQRNIKDNTTVLSGDIGTANDASDNAYHVVIGTDIDDKTVLDGFTITGGNADGGSNTVLIGTHPVAYQDGGGIHLQYASPVLSNLTITKNSAVYGGAMYNRGNSFPVIANTIISNNEANGSGGAIHNSLDAAPVAINTLIHHNTAATNGGAVFNQTNAGNGTFANCTFADNSASNGGAVYSDGGLLTFMNTIIWGNTATTNPGTKGTNEVFTYSLVQGQATSGTNLGNVDPLFVGSGNYKLQSSSPCIDKGDYAYYSSIGIDVTTATDLAGKKRLLGTTIDLGVYEALKIVPDANNIVYVNKHVTGGTGYGDSWADAVVELADAMDAARTNTAIKQIWVAAGNYNPLYNAADGTVDDGERYNAFVLSEGVKIYGGFTGTNETSIDQRDWLSNKTIMDGNNVYHVVIGVNLTNNTILDGFTVTGGNADPSGNDINVNLIAVTQRDGGGIHLQKASPILQNLIVTGNYADNDGGGLFFNDYSSPTVRYLTIINNTATYGGGMMNYSSSPVVYNTLIADNTANSGAGVRNYLVALPHFVNVTIANNMGEGINISSSLIIDNCIIWGNTNGSVAGGNNTYNNSLVEGVTAPGVILDTDPLFVGNGDYTLQASSPCLNMGNNALYNGVGNASTDMDLAYKKRLLDGIIDLGAYEREMPGTIVTTEKDTIDPADGLISLREAVMYAIDFVPDTIITFVDTVFYSGSGRNTIMLDSTIYIDKSICIKGTADTLINVASATAADTIFDITKYVVLSDSLTFNTGKIVSTANIDIDASLTNNTAIMDMATNTTVTYNGTNQILMGGEYHNLTVEGTQSGGGTITKILADDVDVKGNLDLNGTADNDYIILQGDGNNVQLTDYGQPSSNLSNINYIHIENVQFGNIIHLNNNNTVDSTDIKNAETYIDNIKVYIPVLDAIATALTYGDTLGVSTITSATGVTARGQLIPGTLEFRDGATMPKVSDSNLTKYPLAFDSKFSPPYLLLDSTTVTVNKREIEVLIANDTITYGQDANINYTAYEVTATKDTLAVGDVLSGLSKIQINAPSGNQSSSNFYTAGKHQLENSTITILDAFSTDVSVNYDITFANGTLVVDSLGIDIINLTLKDKVYDGTDTTSVDSFGTLQTVIVGDDVNIDRNNVIAYFADKNAGSNKPITQLSTLTLTGTDAGNYKLLQQPSNLTATISKAELQFQLTAVKDKEYDGNKSAEIDTYTLATPIVGDDVDVDLQSSILEFSDKNVGQSKTVTVDTIMLAGVDKDNYFVTVLTPTSTASVTPKELQVQIAAVKDKEYDGNKSAEIDTYTLATPIVGDDVDIDLTASILEFSDKNVGNAKTVTVDTIMLAGLDKANYTVKILTPVPTASITAKELEVQITNVKDKVYDGNNSAELNTYTLVNPLAGDNVSVDVSNSSLEFSDKNAGNSKTVSVNSLMLAGTDKDNYTVKVLNPIPTASITARELQLQVTGIRNKEYDGNRTAELSTYTLANSVSGDDVDMDITGSSFEFSDKNVGTAKTVTANSVVLTGTDKNNYTVKVLSPIPTASITAKQLTVDASSIIVSDKVYDGTTSAQMQIGSPNILNGIAGTDNVSVNTGASTAAFQTSNAGVNKIVNINIVITGTDASNYTVLQPNATATIQQRPVTVTADNSSKKFGETDPAFTYTITNGNLIGNDQFISGSLIRTSTAEDPGQYDIIASPAFSAGNNYDITFVDGVFTIIPSDEANITELYIDTEEWDINSAYIIGCDDTNTQLEIEIMVSPGAIVDVEQYDINNGKILLNITTGENIWKINYTVTAQDQVTTKDYTLVIKKHLVFDDIVVQKFDNVLVVNNNPDKNGGFNFVSYKWYSYKDNESPSLISTKQYYSAGDNRGDVLDVESTYYVVLKTTGGDEFRTCASKPVLTEPISVTVYPNPAITGEEISIDAAGVSEALLKNAQIELYNMAGNIVYSCPVQGRITVIDAPGSSGAYIIKLKTDEFYKNIGVIVK